jgi:formylglycine-generating enzyme required for sulfatase activity
MFRKAARIFIAVMLVATAQAALAEKRVALVIGNSNYANVARLPNPMKDADAIAGALTRLGFDVTHIDNLGVGAMRKTLAAFEEKASGADWALVYYAGHGMEMDGKNWIVPVDAALAKASDVADEAVPLDRILERVRPASSLRIVILDACRNNPFLARMLSGPGGSRSIGRGLAPIQPQRGEVVFYAARDGHTAMDGDGAHSPFAQAMLNVIEKPGLELGFFFREVTSEVLEATAPESQEPFVYGSLPRQQYYFKEPDAPPPATQTAIVAPPRPTPAPQKSAEDACDGLLVSVAMPGEKPCIKPGSGESFKDCSDCPEMVIAPSGSFMMGSPESEPERYSNEGPRHRVIIAKPFAVGRFAVAFAEWDACVAADSCSGDKADDLGWGRGDRPVVNVSWDDAKAYVSWLSKKTGKSYRLLSEAEREYVTRAGTTTPFWWGLSITLEQANYDGRADPYKGGGKKGEDRRKTVPVQSFEANRWGLFQVHGNVGEWAEDCWHNDYNGAPSDGTPWISGDCSRRVLRGGSWLFNPRELRAASRDMNNPDLRTNYIGFRVARTLD